MLRRTPIKSRARREWEARIAAHAERKAKPVRKLERAPNYCGTTAGAAPKTEPKRNRALLDMARGRPCLLLFPWVDAHPVDTVVACHSNLSIHGKAGARKADDHFSAWGCADCHRMLDQGTVSAEVKLERFMAAHRRQVEHWKRIAADPGEPARFRKAAQWALEQLGTKA
jgi:hypothetical protein